MVCSECEGEEPGLAHHGTVPGAEGLEVEGLGANIMMRLGAGDNILWSPEAEVSVPKWPVAEVIWRLVCQRVKGIRGHDGAVSDIRGHVGTVDDINGLVEAMGDIGGRWGAVVTNIRGPRGVVVTISMSWGAVSIRAEVSVTRVSGAEVINIVRPGNIIGWLTCKCGDTWRLVCQCAAYSQCCGGHTQRWGSFWRPQRRPGSFWCPLEAEGDIWCVFEAEAAVIWFVLEAEGYIWCVFEAEAAVTWFVLEADGDVWSLLEAEANISGLLKTEGNIWYLLGAEGSVW